MILIHGTFSHQQLNSNHQMKQIRFDQLIYFLNLLIALFITNYRIIVNIPILRINHNSRIRSRLVLNSFLSTKFIYLHIFFLIGFLAQNLTVHSKKIILFINFVFVKLSRHDDGRYWIFLTKFIKFHSVCRINVFFFRLKF